MTQITCFTAWHTQQIVGLKRLIESTGYTGNLEKPSLHTLNVPSPAMSKGLGGALSKRSFFRAAIIRLDFIPQGVIRRRHNPLTDAWTQSLQETKPGLTDPRP